MGICTVLAEAACWSLQAALNSCRKHSLQLSAHTSWGRRQAHRVQAVPCYVTLLEVREHTQLGNGQSGALPLKIGEVDILRSALVRDSSRRMALMLLGSSQRTVT